jgi:hypothetical protein
MVLLENQSLNAQLQRSGRVRLAWAVTLALLITSTWPLWTPLRAVPHIAPAAMFAVLPAGFDFVGLFLLLVSLVLAVRHRSLRATGIATLALGLLMAFDQLRWQPWSYHALLVGLILASCEASISIKYLRLLTVSIYAYAAIAKLDATYSATLGQQIITTFASWLGGSLEGLSLEVRHRLALAPPLFELTLAILLLASLRFYSLRRPTCYLAVAMHAATIALLGPWALGHSLGVLLWNIGFAWQACVLFWPAVDSNDSSAPQFSNSLQQRFAVCILLIALAAPTTMPWGIWDRWPSWGLYAPAGERAAVFIHSGALDRLPGPLRDFVDPQNDDDDTPWRRLWIDRWVLNDTGAPIYPQNRVRLALAASIAQRYGASERVQVVIQGHANRFSGERSSQTLTGAAEILRHARWLSFDPSVVWTE